MAPPRMNLQTPCLEAKSSRRTRLLGDGTGSVQDDGAMWVVTWSHVHALSAIPGLSHDAGFLFWVKIGGCSVLDKMGELRTAPWQNLSANFRT